MKILTFLAAAVVIILTILVININEKETKIQLFSPFLSQEKVLGVNLWFPSLVSADQTNISKVTADAAIFIDSKTGQVLFAKNPTQRLPIASLVKVMTALIALEHKSMDDEYVVSQKAADMESDKMLLIAGEKLTLKELLYGIFLISANDGAEVLAEGTLRQTQGKQGSREEFLGLMNNKARQLGMKDSYFANPTGLDEDINNSYSTAYDLAILTRYLIRNYPEVVEISQTPHIYLPITQTHQDYDMYSGINLLTTYPGVVGFKTGYTPVAGYTLITLARKNGHEVIGILLNSGYRRDEAKELLDYSFKKLNP